LAPSEFLLRRQGPLAALALLAGLHSAQAPTRSPAIGLMNDLTEQFRALETSLDRGQLAESVATAQG
jgi:hypothetical protein